MFWLPVDPLKIIQADQLVGGVVQQPRQQMAADETRSARN